MGIVKFAQKIIKTEAFQKISAEKYRHYF